MHMHMHMRMRMHMHMHMHIYTYMQDILKEPNWRPRFRFYHPAISFCGLVLCLFIMFFTRW